jgi:hypothetical protein
MRCGDQLNPPSKATEMGCPRHVCLVPDSDRTEDVVDYYPSAGNWRRLRHRLSARLVQPSGAPRTPRTGGDPDTVACCRRLCDARPGMHLISSMLQRWHGFPTRCGRRRACDPQLRGLSEGETLQSPAPFQDGCHVKAKPARRPPRTPLPTRKRFIAINIMWAPSLMAQANTFMPRP